jgi:hypothetical protein
MSAPYNVPGAAVHEPAEAWHWDNQGTQGGQWILTGTNDKGYNCTEYAKARLFGRRPKWNGDPAETIELEEIEQELRDHGFTEPPAPADCGCGQEQLKHCAVLYFAKDATGRREAVPYHIEVFDPKYCDWAGKANAGGPIRHRLDPAEFPFDPAARADTVRLYLCGPGAGVDYYPDEELHRDAINLAEPQTSTVPRSLFYLLVGAGLGWVLYNWLGS